MRDAIAELRAARRTVLLTTHNLTEAEELADRIMVIRDGLVVAEGTRDQLTRQLLGEPIWELRLAGPAHDIAQTAERHGADRGERRRLGALPLHRRARDQPARDRAAGRARLCR